MEGKRKVKRTKTMVLCTSLDIAAACIVDAVVDAYGTEDVYSSSLLAKKIT